MPFFDFSVGGDEECLPTLLGILGCCWDSVTSAMENTPMSLRRWVSPLRLSHLGLEHHPHGLEVADCVPPLHSWCCLPIARSCWRASMSELIQLQSCFASLHSAASTRLRCNVGCVCVCVRVCSVQWVCMAGLCSLQWVLPLWILTRSGEIF